MRRILVTLSTLAMLAVLVALPLSFLLWHVTRDDRGIPANLVYGFGWYGRDLDVVCSRGTISIMAFLTRDAPRSTLDITYAGFALDRYSFPVSKTEYCVDYKCTIALALPLVIFALYPLTAAIRGPLLRRIRRRRGRCVMCGYNLTGNTSGTCPECGGRSDRC